VVKPFFENQKPNSVSLPDRRDFDTCKLFEINVLLASPAG
jgi:hypothetical protein